MIRTRFAGLAVALVAGLLLAGCARQMHGAVEPSAPGFLLGLVQGFIAPFSFVVSLFSDDVRVYAVPNNGGWYNFGFVLGIGGFASGARQTRR
jgi:hypothetical protein